MKIVLTGATGFVGRALCLHLSGLGHALTAWVRDVARAREIVGDAIALVPTADADELVRAVADADAVIHLAGEPIVGRRWTAARKRALIESRVATARTLGDAIARRARPLPVLISASAVGYYGDRGDEILDEASPAGEGFAAELCRAWEDAALEAGTNARRVVRARIGIVLGRHGGALAPLARVARLGLGGAVGGGAQWVPWIHLDDCVRALAHALVTPTVTGPLALVGPEPARQRDFARAIARAVHRPGGLPAPRLAMRALLGEAASVLLASQRVVPTGLARTGFAFAFPELAGALADLLSGEGRVAIRPVQASELPTSRYVATHAPAYVLVARTVIERPLAEVAAFFATPENLALMTPPNLAFHIRTPRPIAMAEGAVIDYTIGLSKIPMAWRTVIERWEPGRLFVDAQHRGPYAAWWHEHHFSEDAAGRTIMEDRVYYAPPLGVLGRLANRLFVARMLEDIFAYRAQVVRLRFPALPVPLPVPLPLPA